MAPWPAISEKSISAPNLRTYFPFGRRSILQLCVLLLLAMVNAQPAKAGEIEPVFSKHDPASAIAVSHADWEKLLKAHIRPGTDGLNRVDYAAFKSEGQGSLKTYLQRLQKVDVSKLSRAEQFAFWANLYNAKTIDIVLDHYPVKSIRDIDISPGLFANGPWGKKVVKVKGVALSLDDIEHKILRGLWREPRVHYAVNCASIGCPNLPLTAFTGTGLEQMLDEAARSYINASRGVSVRAGSLTASKIYHWFKVDFGSDEASVLGHIRKYAKPKLVSKLRNVTGITDYTYDWDLNDIAVKK